MCAMRLQEGKARPGEKGGCLLPLRRSSDDGSRSSGQMSWDLAALAAVANAVAAPWRAATMRCADGRKAIGRV